MFTDWTSDTDQNKIQPVLQKFAVCTVSHLKMCLLKDISFILECKNRESLTITIRQLFNRLQVERCEFKSITPYQILRDKVVFGIRDSKVRERLLREKNLSLEKTINEICRSQETMVQEMRVVGDAGLSIADAGNVNAVSKKPKRGKT